MTTSTKTTVRYWFDQQQHMPRYISFQSYLHALEYVANVTKLEDPNWRAEIVPYSV